MIRKRTQARHFFIALCSVFFYILYVSASDIYPFLPPLMGLMFVMFHRYYDSIGFFTPAIILLCILFYELDKSLVVGIMPAVFFATHFFVAQRLESILLMNAFFVFIYVAIVYLFYFAGMLLCNILFKAPILDFSIIYFYYFVLDTVLALAYYIFIKDQ